MNFSDINRESKNAGLPKVGRTKASKRNPQRVKNSPFDGGGKVPF